MDAVKFLEECRRMINLGESVPLADCDVTAEEVVANVEWWSKNNPRKTRQSEFLKLFPNAELDYQGVIIVDPCDIDKTMHGKDEDCYNGNCDDCRNEFWMQEVE